MAYHAHWPLAEILDLEHPLRQAFARQLDTLGQRADGQPEQAQTGW